MKKFFFLAMSVFFLMSCEGPTGPRGPQGPPGSGSEKTIRDIEVRSTDWKYQPTKNGIKEYYYYEVDPFTFLDQYIYDYGNLSAFLDYGDAQQSLPIVRRFQERNGAGDLIQWTRTIDCEFSIERITFYVTDSKLNPERPDDMLFRIVLED